jgi:hypothetical protein
MAIPNSPSRPTHRKTGIYPSRRPENTGAKCVNFGESVPKERQLPRSS